MSSHYRAPGVGSTIEAGATTGDCAHALGSELVGTTPLFGELSRSGAGARMRWPGVGDGTTAPARG